jgi:hypothetical protein
VDCLPKSTVNSEGNKMAETIPVDALLSVFGIEYQTLGSDPNQVYTR